MIRRVAFTVALSAALLLATAVGAAPARAADEIGLSSDGVVWYDELHRPLFDPARSWVPGDEATASFHVRNRGSSAARLDVKVRDADGVDLLADDDVSVAVRATGGAWHAVEQGVPSSWLTERAIARGGQVQVDVKVSFRWRSPNTSMLQRLPLDFEVRLVEAGAPGGPDGPDGPNVPDGADGSDDSDGPTGLLPDTGSAVSPLLVWLGAVLVGIGLALLAAARRRRAEEPEDHDEGAELEAAIAEGVRVDG